MKTVWKFNVPLSDNVTVAMPRGARILHVGVQSELTSLTPTFQLWALVDTEDKIEYKTFRIAGTGHKLNDEETQNYIGTVFFQALVFHVFNILEV